jgi:hypothetical protein
MVLICRLNAETGAVLCIAYSKISCLRKQERNLKLEETCTKNKVFWEIYFSQYHCSWIASA